MKHATGKPSLILGVDGGGSKTSALLASVDEYGDIHVLGRGRGGPSNLKLAGKEQSLASLNQAIDEALVRAEMPGRKLDYCVLALAGSTSPDVQRDVSAWAQERRLSRHVEVIHDSGPVLAHGTADGWGIALIVGTGSVAVGTDIAGNSVIKGGWGHWFGDKGSGFYLGYKALAAVAEASDEIGPETILSELVMEALGTADPRSILGEVSAGGDTRREVAALAPIVIDAAGENDAVAVRIINGAVSETAKLVKAVAKAVKFEKPFPLALAGGVVCGSELFREKLITRLNRSQPHPGEINVVSKPVMGCLKIARTRLREVYYPGQP